MKLLKYNIVLEENESFVLASCPTLEKAKKYLEEMKRTDEYLSKYYNWNKMPKYKIVESEDK